MDEPISYVESISKSNDNSLPIASILPITTEAKMEALQGKLMVSNSVQRSVIVSKIDKILNDDNEA